jgi:hypothetical protein
VVFWLLIESINLFSWSFYFKITWIFFFFIFLSSLFFLRRLSTRDRDIRFINNLLKVVTVCHSENDFLFNWKTPDFGFVSASVRIIECEIFLLPILFHVRFHPFHSDRGQGAETSQPTLPKKFSFRAGTTRSDERWCVRCAVGSHQTAKTAGGMPE